MFCSSWLGVSLASSQITAPCHVYHDTHLFFQSTFSSRVSDTRASHYIRKSRLDHVFAYSDGRYKSDSKRCQQKGNFALATEHAQPPTRHDSGTCAVPLLHAAGIGPSLLPGEGLFLGGGGTAVPMLREGWATSVMTQERLGGVGVIGAAARASGLIGWRCCGGRGSGEVGLSLGFCEGAERARAAAGEARRGPGRCGGGEAAAPAPLVLLLLLRGAGPWRPAAFPGMD